MNEKRRPLAISHTFWRQNLPPRKASVPRPRYRRVTPFKGLTYYVQWNEGPPPPDGIPDLSPWLDRLESDES